MATDILKTKQTLISPNLEDTSCITIIENNQISFIIEISILDHQKQFNLFTIVPVPSYLNTSSHIPDPDSNHIAINMQGDKYTTVTNIELTKCLDKPPDCRSKKPVSPMANDQSSCVATTVVSRSIPMVVC